MSLIELSNTVLIYVCYRYGIQSCFLLEIADETSNFNTLFLLSCDSVNSKTAVSAMVSRSVFCVSLFP